LEYRSRGAVGALGWRAGVYAASAALDFLLSLLARGSRFSSEMAATSIRRFEELIAIDGERLNKGQGIGYRIDRDEIIRLHLLFEVAAEGALHRISVRRQDAGIVNHDTDELVAAERPSRAITRGLSTGIY